MTIGIEAENAQHAESMVQEAYGNQEYILNVEHFTSVDFITKEKKWMYEVESKAPQAGKLIAFSSFFRPVISETNCKYFNIRPVSYVAVIPTNELSRKQKYRTHDASSNKLSTKNALSKVGIILSLYLFFQGNRICAIK